MFKKPNKQDRNAEFLRSSGYEADVAYKEQFIDPKKTFLIICEGQNTEPEYFKGFPVPTKAVLIKGGCNTKSKLVEYALEIQNQPDYEGREVWCVFDYDKKLDEALTQPKDFNKAITLAEQNGMKVAWSNDAFELWLLYHYENIESCLTRNEIYKKLKGLWGLKSFSGEAKKLEFCKTLYSRHLQGEASQSLAIRWAKEQHKKFEGRNDFSNHCPCTTVYLLVEELNKNLKE